MPIATCMAYGKKQPINIINNLRKAPSKALFYLGEKKCEKFC